MCVCVLAAEICPTSVPELGPLTSPWMVTILTNPDREQKKRKHAPKPEQSRSSFVTVKETAHVFAWGVVVSQSTAC